jgi:hypothetical protein
MVTFPRVVIPSAARDLLLRYREKSRFLAPKPRARNDSCIGLAFNCVSELSLYSALLISSRLR